MGPIPPPHLLLPPPSSRVDFVLIHGGKSDANSSKKPNKEYPLWNLRVWAFTIDLYAVLFIRKGITLAFFHFVKIIFWQMPLSTKGKMFSYLPAFDGLVFFACFFAYFFLCYYLGEGQTLGKKILRLQVKANSQGDSIQPWQAALRAYGALAEVLSCGLISFIMKKMKSEKTLSDLIAQTTLVKCSASSAKEVKVKVKLNHQANHSKSRAA